MIANKICFIATLHSQMHLNAFKAFYLNEKRMGNLLHGIIRIRGDDDKYFIGKDELFFLSGCNLEYLEKVPKPSILNRFLRLVFNTIYSIECKLGKLQKELSSELDDDVLFIIAPGPFIPSLYEYRELKNQFPHRRIIFILLEEGIGLYIRDEERWRQRGRENLSGVRKWLWKTKLFLRNFLIAQKEAEKVFQKNNRLKRFYLFHHENGHLVVNQDVCDSFALAYRMNGHPSIPNVYKGRIVFNTQPFCEELQSDADLNCIKAVLKILRKCHIDMVIKPHPREKKLDRYRQLGVEIDNSNYGMSQETLLANCENMPIAIMGFFSTTLITGNLFFSVPAICLGKLINREDLNGFNDDIENFMQTFSDILHIPENEDELETILHSIQC